LSGKLSEKARHSHKRNVQAYTYCEVTEMRQVCQATMNSVVDCPHIDIVTPLMVLEFS